MPQLSARQNEALRAAKEFNETEAPAFADIMDRDNRLPEELVPRLAQYGLLGIKCSEERGGRDLDTVGSALVIEELARVSPSISDLVLSVNASTGVLRQFASEDVLDRFIPPVTRGERIPAYALTEPTAGSDLAGIRTQATPTDDGYVLFGAKKLITLGCAADFVVLLAVTDTKAEKPTRGMSLLVTEEFRSGRPEEAMGLRGLALGWLSFQKVKVPRANLVGTENQGFKHIMQSLEGGRIETAALAVGLAQGALELALGYARQRRQFGKQLTEYQGIQFMLAEMQAKVDAARALTYEAARLREIGEPHARKASEAKLFASEMALECASESLQVFGGNGYVKEYLVERFFRDAKVIQIFEGTSQIQKLVIARQMLSGDS
jgi:alkylation response protein AidB-like acyl-CoA dehydrogenase